MVDGNAACFSAQFQHQIAVIETPSRVAVEHQHGDARPIAAAANPHHVDRVLFTAGGHGDGLVADAGRELAKDGFEVLCYSSDDPIVARRLKDAGATSVMPAGSPIGSGQGVLNRNNIVLCLEALKAGDAAYPVIVDAGVGSASDVSIAMELGADGVLLNTAIAHARDPVMMAHAMRHAAIAGRQSYLAGRIPRRLYASASSPWEGAISYIPGE